MKGFIEIHTTYNYKNKTLINISDIKAVYELKERVFTIGISSNTCVDSNSIIEKKDGTLFRCIDVYEEIKQKIEEAQK